MRWIWLLIFTISCQSIHFSKDPNLHVPKLPIPKQPPKFALVLGGGGARGLAHIGVLEELEQAGIRPDVIIGCSAGSIVGALYASHPDIKWLKEVLLNQRANDFLNFDLQDLQYGVSTNKHVREFLDKYLQGKHFEDLSIPFISVATNLQTGELTPFFTGPVVPTVVASGAIPGIFRPMELYGTYYIDGGVADPVPVQVARMLKAKVVAAVEIGQSLSNTPPDNIFEVVWRSLAINYLALSERNVLQADVPIDVPLANIGTFADKRNFDIYILGRVAGAKALPQIKKLLGVTAVSSSKKPNRQSTQRK